uniref:Cytochrome P450 n=1 Tax=Octopus bimaculoides TaxID=37653 RepID=A0A0L8HJR7_OCTBM
MATTTDINLKMEELRKQFGDIFRLKFGSETLVIVCKTEWILEGLVKKGDELKGRPYWMYVPKRLNRKKENFFPFLRFVLWNSPLKQIIKNNNKIRSYVKEKIREHKETYNGDYIRDFVDVYLLTLEKEPNNESLSEANIFQAIMDLFMAGTDTTSTILNWAFVHMAKYPDIQDKCRAEIEEITDLNRPVTMKDKRHLTYVAATLLEVQRVAPVAPLTVPHAAMVDTTLGGYDIPKNTIVQFMLMAAHYDPNYWDKPEEFRPERWIGENNELKKNEAYMPFSLGPRICAGVSLANIETFMGFSNILQRFRLESPDETPMTMKGKQSGITYVPVNDNVRAIPL